MPQWFKEYLKTLEKEKKEDLLGNFFEDLNKDCDEIVKEIIEVLGA